MRFLCILAGVAMLGAGACAKGTAIATGGSGGASTGSPGGAGPSGPTGPTTGSQSATSAGPSTTGSNVTTGAGTTTGATNGATTAASTSSTGTPCSESPCKLTSPQCGCPSGDMCTIIGGARTCKSAGTQAVGQACSASNDCSAGSMCLAPKTINSCLQFCSTDADCQAPGGICFFNVSNGMGGNVPNAMLCTQNCDPTSPTSCVVSGLGCQAAQDMTTLKIFTYCPESGTAGNMAACPNGSSDCLPGYGCFMTTSNVCLRWCKFPAGAGCPSGTTCQHLGTPMIVGTTEYGACG